MQQMSQKFDTFYFDTHLITLYKYLRQFRTSSGPELHILSQISPTALKLPNIIQNNKLGEVATAATVHTPSDLEKQSR